MCPVGRTCKDFDKRLSTRCTKILMSNISCLIESFMRTSLLFATTLRGPLIQGSHLQRFDKGLSTSYKLYRLCREPCEQGPSFLKVRMKNCQIVVKSPSQNQTMQGDQWAQLPEVKRNFLEKNAITNWHITHTTQALYVEISVSSTSAAKSAGLVGESSISY